MRVSKVHSLDVVSTNTSTAYNFWEPMHYLDRGYGFQTWEVSPQYAIRSWAYIVLHWLPVSNVVRFLGVDKVFVFRLGFISKILT